MPLKKTLQTINDMKKVLLQLMILATPLMAFPQQNGWTEEQQEQFRQQMDEFRDQLQQQMAQLHDSLAQMQLLMKEQDWSAFDSTNWNWSEAPLTFDSIEIPEPPSVGIFEVNPNDDSTEVRI